MAGLYPFDPTGTASSNFIGSPTPETHTITATQGANLNYIVPLAAPFYRAGLVVRKRVGNTYTTLVEGIDYILTHRFLGATQALGKPVFGSISLLNSAFSGIIGLSYQTLGGDWVLDDNTIIRSLTNNLYNGNARTISWDQVAGYPQQFPPGPHSQPLSDFKGMEDLIDVLEQVQNAILTAADDPNNVQGLVNAHATSPSAHTPSQIGLGNVQNFGVASFSDAQNGNSDTLYMTPTKTVTLMGFFNAGTASKLRTPRTIELTGAVVGNVQFDGSGNVSISTTLVPGQSGLPSNDWNTILNIPADLVSGTLGLNRFPALPGSVIGSGTIDAARIPGLDCSHVTTGVFDLARIPTLDVTRLPNIPTTKITGTLAVEAGGTGAVDGPGARTNLYVYSKDEVYNKTEVYTKTEIRQRSGIGSVVAFATDVLQPNHLMCDGPTLSRTVYAELFAVIGTRWGAGDGSTTFKGPDYRGVFLRGFDAGVGIDIGRVFGVRQTDEIKSHYHHATMQVSYTAISGVRATTWSGDPLPGLFAQFDTEETGGIETRPINDTVTFQIRYQ